jgi:hypothetical protein
MEPMPKKKKKSPTAGSTRKTGVSRNTNKKGMSTWKQRYADKLCERPDLDGFEYIESTGPAPEEGEWSGPWALTLHGNGSVFYVEHAEGYPEYISAWTYFGPFRSEAEGSAFLNDLADDLLT